MAKKKRAKRSGRPGGKPAAERPAPAPSEAAAPEPQPGAPATERRGDRSAEPVRAPAFWFGFEVAWAKLAAARFIIFMLLALDAVLQLGHAPRYGAGDFNVGQLPVIGELAPGRVAFGAAQLLMAYMFVLVAFGVAARVLVPICAAIYAWVYFTSQLDSYQHHYLVVMMLVIASFVPWQRPAGAGPETPVRAWAVRLWLVQLAIMYLWAAISKLHPAWLDGTTLSMQMRGELGATIAKTIGFPVAAALVIAVELALAATVWTRPAWIVAAPLGLLFHAGILLTGLEIGLFAVLMIGIYTLVVPDRVWTAVLRPLDGIVHKLGGPSWAALGLGVVAGLGIARLVRFEDGFVLAIVACVVPLGVAIHALAKQRIPPMTAGVAHVVAIVVWLAVDRVSTVTVDYFRFWGGSQRRIGKPETAEHAYRRLTEVAPDYEPGHYQLGKLLLARGEATGGIEHLRTAQRLEPGKARAFIAEARYLQSQGNLPEAIEKAKQATYADPSDAEARALLGGLVANKPPAQPTATDDDPEEP